MEDALNRYYQHFGENYPIMIVSAKTDDEIIERIDYCIKHNKKEIELDYEENNDY